MSSEHQSSQTNKLLATHKTSSNQTNHQNMQKKIVLSPEKSGFNLLRLSSYILLLLVFLFVAAIYYGIINP